MKRGNKQPVLTRESLMFAVLIRACKPKQRRYCPVLYVRHSCTVQVVAGIASLQTMGGATQGVGLKSVCWRYVSQKNHFLLGLSMDLNVGVELVLCEAKRRMLH